MDRQKFLNLVEKQAMGQTTVEEDLIIFRIYDQMQKRDIPVGIDKSEEKFIQRRIKAAINSRISPNTEINKPSIPWYFKVAATIALLVSLSISVFYVFQEADSAKILNRSTNQEQKATVTLADGTKVYLNVLSEIRFPEKFDNNNRTVEVKGEAFFEVTPDKDRPFIVKSNGLTTKVLGTSFNLNSYNGNDVMVAVKTGKVEVAESMNSSKKVLLLPNQKATFARDTQEFLVEEVDMDYYLDWRNKTISFHLNSIEEVLERISRVYNMQINLKGYDGGDCLIKATYPNNNLYSILYGLQNLVDFEYSWIGEKTLEINYKGCKN